jgi:hypothetical protein
VADWSIEPFGKHHDRSGFSCGKAALDDFIVARVSQYEKRRFGKTFVVVAPGEKRVIGYFTLSAGAVAFEDMPTGVSRKLPKHPVPVVLFWPGWPWIDRLRERDSGKCFSSTPSNGA